MRRLTVTMGAMVNDLRATHEAPALLADASEPCDGWSDQYGGPEGVATLAFELQENLRRQSQHLAALRAAAIRELLRTRSLAEVGRMLGISKQAVSKASRAQGWDGPF